MVWDDVYCTCSERVQRDVLSDQIKALQETLDQQRQQLAEAAVAAQRAAKEKDAVVMDREALHGGTLVSLDRWMMWARSNASNGADTV